jgi:hypothetical protein
VSIKLVICPDDIVDHLPASGGLRSRTTYCRRMVDAVTSESVSLVAIASWLSFQRNGDDLVGN